MRETYYAHSDPDRPGEGPEATGARWQLLESHLGEVASLSAGFAYRFDSQDWGFLAGLWHDLGKYRSAFQQRLHGAAIRANHAGVGAALALEVDPKLQKGLPLAFVIAGHHAGLHNHQAAPSGERRLVDRLKDYAAELEECRNAIPDTVRNHPLPHFPDFLIPKERLNQVEADALCRLREMWVRFLFSCLIDADRLNTATFSEPEVQGDRGGYDSIPELRERCDEFIDQKIAALSPSECDSMVNRARRDILKACRNAAPEPRGIFFLTVPTGGGKTLSALSFALRHAETHGLERIFVVIPFTSIIEQNARVYRDCLGDGNILEHHSNLDPEARDDDDPQAKRHRLAAENWDAPVVVTTTVQFFETLFTHRPSRARRLHSVARSVIILDEVQSLPVGLLAPILDGLKQLTGPFGCTVVLSTATPPALLARERFDAGFHDVRPIITEPAELARQLERVRFEWPDLDAPAVELNDLAEELTSHDQVLCVVHRRRDARELAELLHQQDKEQIYHLSALMCPKHRLVMIEKIRQALDQGETCRLVSTQLIEAGVDLDFPVVYRALGGLDSIVQAAGRCNREGRLNRGRVVVFRAPSQPPPGVPRTALGCMESLLRERGGSLAASDPTVFDTFFRMLYASQSLDQKNIQSNRRVLNFETVSRDFKMIEDQFTQTVVVPWGDAEERVARLRHAANTGMPTRYLLRAIQPFTVSVYESAFRKLQAGGALEEVLHGVYWLNVTHHYLYDEVFGLVEGDEPPVAAAEELIV